jgi:hypothetical protein
VISGGNHAFRVLGGTGGTVSTQVTNSDGTEADLIEHLNLVHLKGTKGFTDEYLANLHKMLHQRKRDPLPEHTHPADLAEEAAEAPAEV